MKPNDPLARALACAFPHHEPSAEFKDRVASIEPKRRHRAVWYAIGFSSAAACLVAAALLAPTPALADLVLKQVDGMKGHLTIYEIRPDGSRHRSGEGWIWGSKIRLASERSGHAETVEDPANGIDVSWDPASGQLHFHHGRVGSFFPPGVVTADSVKSFIADRAWMGKPRVSQEQFDGRQVDCVTIAGRPYPRSNALSELRIFAVPETHRLIAFESKFVPAGKPRAWVTLTVLDDRQPPEGVFGPTFEINGVATDVVKERERWRSRWSKPLAAYDVPGGKLAVRSVTRNPAGDVFVLYTAPKDPRPYGEGVLAGFVTDASRETYLKGGGFSPSDGPSRDYRPFAYEGRPLLGAWFVRLHRGRAHGPVTVGFRNPDVPPRKLIALYRAQPEELKTSVPAYMPYMAMGVVPEDRWEQGRDLALSGHFQALGAYKAEEPVLRDFIALAKRGNGVTYSVPAWMYSELGHAVEAQGRRKEALEIMKRALEVDQADTWGDPNGTAAREIRAAIKRLSR
jgi:hypothetical protein